MELHEVARTAVSVGAEDCEEGRFQRTRRGVVRALGGVEIRSLSSDARDALRAYYMAGYWGERAGRSAVIDPAKVWPEREPADSPAPVLAGDEAS